jgi:hypothetical protein
LENRHKENRTKIKIKTLENMIKKEPKKTLIEMILVFIKPD